jgi:Zn-dependent protease with chaperone function
MGDEITINNLFKEELDIRLYNLICEIKNKSGVKGKIFVYVIEDLSYKPNAFGESIPSDSKLQKYEGKLTITRGIFKKINIDTDPDELKSLIAHEFSHISNKDSVNLKIFLGLWIATCFIIPYLALLFSINTLLSFEIETSSILMVGRAYYLWRRQIETRCDREAVNITKNPEASIRSLKKINVDYASVKDTLRIKERVKYHTRKCWHWVFGNTHPSLDERIKNIESLKQN